ncbi:MAG TPA: arylsulfatase [bacterium]|nr:arylsulfatase [bacterium]
MANHLRRDFLKTLALGGMCAAIPRVSMAAKPKGRLPNIVLILADDMGFGDLACENPESKIPTPHLDRLATEGIRFTDAHSPSAVCSPTRYGILTGRYAWRSQLKSSVLWPWDSPLIEPDRMTVGHLLKEHGYTTACIGKWHLGWDWPTSDNSRVNDSVPIGSYEMEKRIPFGEKVVFSETIRNGPITRGFDYYFGDDVPNFPPYCFIENDRTIGIPNARRSTADFGPNGPAMENWDLVQVLPTLTRKATEFIRAKPGEGPFQKARKKPFFLYFSLTGPHTPIVPAPEFTGKSRAGIYGDYMCEIDWVVGQVMKALEESGQVENTLVIFTSDNGSPGLDGTNMAGTINSVLRFGHNSSYIYRGIKTDAWEGGHRIPFLARWPGHIPSNAVSDEPICLVDFFATCAAIVDHPLPENAAEDSYNILPALLGKEYDSPIREATVYHSYNGMFAIRKGDWKLILCRGGGGWRNADGAAEYGPPMQLYTMRDDPSETRNRYERHPEIVKELAELLEKYRQGGRSAPRR